MAAEEARGQGGGLRVFVVDLLSLSPFYDRYFVEALQRAGSDVTLYATRFPYEPDYLERSTLPLARGLWQRAAALGLRDARLRRSLQVVEYVRNLGRLLADVRRERPQIVHFQWLPLLPVSSLELGLLPLLRSLGAATVYTAHNAVPHDSGRRLRTRYQRAAERFDGIVCLSRSVERELVDELGVAPARVTRSVHGPMFHDLSRPTRSEARALLGLGDMDTLLFLGLLRPYKGLLDLLEALPRVLAERPRTQLVIAGQGEPPMLRELATAVEQMGLAEHVVLRLGYVPLADVPSYHAAADVVVLPYREATQSGALMGAAGLGTVPVCTSVGGLGELLSQDESRGYLAPPCDPEGLARALLRALSAGPEERARRASALASHAAEHSSWDRAAQTTLEAYRAALTTPR